MKIEFTGVIRQLGEPLHLTTNAGQPFVKREMLIETQEQYPETIAVSLTGDNATGFYGQVGQTVTVGVHFRARFAGDRFHNDIRAWNYIIHQ